MSRTQNILCSGLGSGIPQPFLVFGGDGHIPPKSVLSLNLVLGPKIPWGGALMSPKPISQIMSGWGARAESLGWMKMELELGADPPTSYHVDNT